MCGRYRRPGKQKIAETFAVDDGLDELDLELDDHASPQSMQPVIFLNEDGKRQIRLMRWAFKLPDRLLFNARSEGIEKSKFWGESFSKRRCIVPANSIFESQDLSNGRKGDRYELTLPDREVFGMAGVWQPWQNPKTAHWEPTFAILTGEPNETASVLHDRLATILDPRDYQEYLADAKRPPVHLLRILPSDQLQATRLEKSANKSQKLSEPQISLFGDI